MPPEPRYHHGNLREAALAEAAALLEARGESEVSLRRLAERVGVTHRALYRHFPDREALMAEVACGSLCSLHDALQTAAAEAGPEPRARLVRVVDAYLDFALAHPAVYRQAFTAGFAKRDAHPELAKAARTLGKAFGALVAALPRPPAHQHHAKDDAIALWGLLHGLIDLYWGGSLRANSQRAARSYIIEQVQRVLGLGPV